MDVTSYSAPVHRDLLPQTSDSPGGSAPGGGVRNETSYSSCASESQPLRPSLNIKCHSFQPPCSYSYRIRPTTTNGLPPYTPSLAIWIGELSGGRSATSPTR